MNSKYQICYCKKDFITHSLTFEEGKFYYFETDFDEPNDSVWVIYNEIGDQGIRFYNPILNKNRMGKLKIFREYFEYETKIIRLKKLKEIEKLH